MGAFACQAARNIVGKGRRGPAAPKRAKLSNRQLECIALVARGKSDWEIGKILGISQLTVKRHMLLAREQLNVTKRIQIAMRALFDRSEEHTSELQSLMRISYAVFCLKKKTKTHTTTSQNTDKY